MSSRDIIRVCGLFVALLGAVCPVATTARADVRGAPERGWPDDGTTAEGCPTHARIAQRIEVLLGRTLREADPALRIETRLERTATGYLLTLRTGHETSDGGVVTSGTRAFEGARCEELAEAAALLVALSVDPLAVPGQDEPRVQPTSTVATTAAPTASPDDARLASARALRGALRAGALLDVGYLPRAGLGVELGASLSFVRSRFALSALWLPGVRSSRADDGARVEVALWAARASYCHRALGEARGLLAVAGCLGLELGRASGDGVGVLGPRQTHFVWSAGWLALRLSTALTRWLGVALEPGLVVPFARSTFVSSAADGSPRAQLHTPAPVAARVALSLEALF